MSRITDPITLWRTITQAGSIAAYVDTRLRELGYLVQRRETDNMSERELADYKKSLKAEAAERRKVRKEAWLAYKATHIVHLGESVFWNDEAPTDGAAAVRAGGKTKGDKWDLPNAEERAAENEL